MGAGISLEPSHSRVRASVKQAEDPKMKNVVSLTIAGDHS